MSQTTLEIPQGVPSDGTVRVDFIPAGGIADGGLAALLAEVQAATAEMIGCHMFGIGMGANTERKEKRRLCSKYKYELLGATTYTIDALQYIYDVQNDGSEANRAYEALSSDGDASGYLVVRWGMDAAEPLAEGQIVDIFAVRLGVQVKMAPEENDELQVTQEVVVQNQRIDYVLPAA